MVEIHVGISDEKNKAIKEASKEVKGLDIEIKENEKKGDDIYAKTYKEVSGLLENFEKGKDGQFKGIAEIKRSEQEYEAKIAAVMQKVSAPHSPNLDSFQYTNQDRYLNMLLQYSFIVNKLSPFQNSTEMADGNAIPSISNNLKIDKSYKDNYKDYTLTCNALLSYYPAYIQSIKVFNQKCEERIIIRKTMENSLKGKNYQNIPESVNVMDEFYQTNRYKGKLTAELSPTELKEIGTLLNDKNLIAIREFEKSFTMLKQDFYSISKEIISFIMSHEGYDPSNKIKGLNMKAEMLDISTGEKYQSIVYEGGDYTKITKDYEEYKKNNTNVGK